MTEFVDIGSVEYMLLVADDTAAVDAAAVAVTTAAAGKCCACMNKRFIDAFFSHSMLNGETGKCVIILARADLIRIFFWGIKRSAWAAQALLEYFAKIKCSRGQNYTSFDAQHSILTNLIYFEKQFMSF